MPSIYKTEAFTKRVNYAVRCISNNRKTSRTFDTCLEMGDGDYVAVAVYRRSLKNTKLASNIFSYLSKDSVMASVEKLKDISTKDLKKEAVAYLEKKL